MYHCHNRNIDFFDAGGSLRDEHDTHAAYSARRASAEEADEITQHLLGYKPFLAWGSPHRDSLFALIFYTALNPRNAAHALHAFVTETGEDAVTMADVLPPTTMAALRVYTAAVLMGRASCSRWWETPFIVGELARVQLLVTKVTVHDNPEGHRLTGVSGSAKTAFPCRMCW